MNNTEFKTMCNFQKNYWWYKALRKRVYKLMDKYISMENPIILDAGCGCGHLMEYAPKKYTFSGIDINEIGISVMKNKGYNVFNAGVEDIPFNNDYFDAIISLDVLCVKGVNVDESLREMKRVLKNNGILILNMPALSLMEGTHDRYVNIKERYTRKKIDDLMRDYGFKREYNQYWNSLLLPVFFLWRKIIGKVIRKNGSDLFYIPNFVNEFLYYLSAMDNYPSLMGGLSVLSVYRKEKI